MARKLRVEYPGAIYHVMNRGDRREPIFRDDEDRQRFLATLGEACGKTGWQVHALCLMPNHFHLVVETPRGNLVAGMKWFLGTYTGRFNRRHKLFGHLFSGRYKAVDRGWQWQRVSEDGVRLCAFESGAGQAAEAGTGVAGVSLEQLAGVFEESGPTLAWLRVDRLLGEYRIPQDSAAGRRQLEEALEQRRAEETGADYKRVRRGWCLGDKTFRKELLEQMKERLGAEHYGEERQETEEAQAEELVQEELKRRHWREENLGRRAKGDAGKVAMAARLRAETAVTVKWIGERLQMGAPGYVNLLLHRRRKAEREKR